MLLIPINLEDPKPPGSQLMPFVFFIGLIVPIWVKIQYPKIVKFLRTALRALCGRSDGSVDWRDCR